MRKITTAHTAARTNAVIPSIETAYPDEKLTIGPGLKDPGGQEGRQSMTAEFDRRLPHAGAVRGTGFYQCAGTPDQPGYCEAVPGVPASRVLLAPKPKRVTRDRRMSLVNRFLSMLHHRGAKHGDDSYSLYDISSLNRAGA
jgi:hypothetical protein